MKTRRELVELKRQAQEDISARLRKLAEDADMFLGPVDVRVVSHKTYGEDDYQLIQVDITLRV